MADETIKALAVQVALDDGSFATGMKSLQRNMTVIDSEFKASVSGIKNWGDNLDALKGNTQALGEKISVQKQVVQAYSEQLDNSKKKLEENSQKMTENKAKLDAAKSAYEQSSASIGKNAEETQKLKAELDKAAAAYKSNEGAVRSNNKDVQNFTIQLNNAKGALNKMDAELAENNAKIKSSESGVSKLKSAFSNLADQSRKSTSSITSGFGSLKGVVAGFATTLVAGLSLNSVITATDSAEKSMAQMDAVLKSTGGAAGMTKTQLNDLANAQSKVTTYSAGTTREAENMLLTFTNVGKNVFPQTITAAEDMATAMGMSATDAAKTLGKALNDPSAGLSKLTKQGVTFTSAQKEQISAMQKAGDTAGAQKVILAELEKEFGGSAKAAGSTFTGQIQIMTNNLKSAGVTITTALLPVVTNLMPSITKAAQNLAEEITAHKGDIQAAVSTVANLLKNIFGFVETHGPLVKGEIIGIVGVVTAWKTAMTIANTVSTISNALQTLGIVKSGAAAAAKVTETAATEGATAAQTGLNIAMLANPIGLIIAAIVALVATFVILWNKCDAFRNFFINLGEGIKNAFFSVVDFVKSNWQQLLMILNPVTAIAGILSLLYKINPQFRGWVDNLVKTVKDGISAGIEWIKNIPSEALTWGKDIIMGIVDGIKNAVSAVGDAVKGVAQNIRSFLHFSEPDVGPLADYHTWMPDFMGGLAKGIEDSKYKVKNAVQGLSTDISVGVKSSSSAQPTDTASTAQTVKSAIQGGSVEIKNYFTGETPSAAEHTRQEKNMLRRLSLQLS